MNTAQKLAIKYKKALDINNVLAAQIGSGNGATGLTATFFLNASKDLTKISNQVRKSLQNGSISVHEYKTIMG